MSKPTQEQVEAAKSVIQILRSVPRTFRRIDRIAKFLSRRDAQIEAMAVEPWREWLKVERDLARGCHIEGVCACCLDKINAYNRRLEQVALTQPAQKQGEDRG